MLDVLNCTWCHFRRNIHRLVHRANRQCGIYRYVTASQHSDVLLHKPLEAGCFHRHTIDPRIYKIEQVVPRGVGLSNNFNAGVHISQRYFGVCYGRVAWVSHHSLYPAPIFLCQRRPG